MLFEPADTPITTPQADAALQALRGAIRAALAANSQLAPLLNGGDPRTAAAHAAVDPRRRPWLTMILHQLAQDGSSQAGTVDPVWATRFEQLAANLAAALKGQAEPTQLFAEAAGDIATAAAQLLRVPVDVSTKLAKAVTAILMKQGDGCSVLEAIDRPAGSMVSDIAAANGKQPQITCFQTPGNQTIQGRAVTGDIHSLTPNWHEAPAPTQPYDLVVFAGGFHGDLDRRRLGAVARHVRAGSLCLYLTPTDQHPLFQLLLGAFGDRFAGHDQGFRDGLAALGLTGIRPLPGLPAEWLIYLAEFQAALETIPDQLVEDDEPAVHAAAGGDTPVTPTAAVPSPAPAQTAPAAPAPVTPVNTAASDHRDAVRGLLEADITGLIEEILHIGADELDRDEDLTELGMDSIMAGELAAKLGYVLGIKIVPTLFFSSNTVNKILKTLVDEFYDALCTYYADKLPQAANPTAQAAPAAPIPVPVPVATPTATAQTASHTGTREPIAILGVAGSFPGAADPAELWANLAAGRECLSDLPEHRWAQLGKTPPFPEGSQPRAGLMPNPEGFDARHFSIAPREAATLDPRQRLVLKWAWQALEAAAVRPATWKGSRTAVFIGVENNEYSELLDPNDPYYGTSTGLTIIANRLSYTYDFNGTSEVVDSACASSLLAVHRAVRALQQGEAETALAGGVSLMQAPHATRQGLEAGMLSPHGKTHSFDSKADGWVIGEGGGLVVLKPLSAAQRDGDPILAIIRGGAANHGGKVSSLTAPNPERMTEVAQTALADAGVTPDTVTLVEAHGVGSSLIDAAEVQGLARAYRTPNSKGRCVLGSLTPNIGNLDPASGIAGLTKLIYAMRHKRIPPQIHCDQPHEHLNLEAGPFTITGSAQPWQPQSREGQAIPRRAGIHSFSWGGGNVHLILEEAPAEAAPAPSNGPYLALFSARTDKALRTRAQQLHDYLNAHPDTDPARLCATLQFGREAMAARLAVLVKSTAELTTKLGQWLKGDAKPGGMWRGNVAEGRPKAAVIGDTPACRTYTAELFHGGFFTKIAALWVEGAAIDWDLCYQAGRPRPLLLPTYTFDEKSFPILPRAAAPPKGLPDRAQLRTLLEAVARGERTANDVLEQLMPTPPAESPAEPTPGTEPLDTDPRSHLTRRLRAMVAEVLHVPEAEIGDTTDLGELGVDSLTGMALMKSLHQQFGNRIPMTLLLSKTTLAGIAATLWRDHQEAVQAGLNGGTDTTRPWSPLVTIQGSGDKPASFWVHGAIGDVSWLIGIAHELGPDYPIYGLEPKGLDGDEPHHSVTEMARAYLDAVQSRQPHGPYYLGGYSGGGIVVMEMTRMLQEQGEEVARLFIGDTFLQGSRYYQDATIRILEDLDLEAVQLCSLANIFAGLQGASAVISYPELLSLSSEERFTKVARHLHDNTNSPRDLAETDAWLRQNIAVGAQLAHVLTSYEPKPLTFVSRTSFFLCSEGFISPESKSRIPITTPTLDHVEHWQQLVPGEMEVVDVPCDHFALMHQPHVNQLIQNIRTHVN